MADKLEEAIKKLEKSLRKPDASGPGWLQRGDLVIVRTR